MIICNDCKGKKPGMLGGLDLNGVVEVGKKTVRVQVKLNAKDEQLCQHHWAELAKKIDFPGLIKDTPVSKKDPEREARRAQRMARREE